MRRSSWSRRGIIVGSASLLILPGARANAQPTRRRPKVAFFCRMHLTTSIRQWIACERGLPRHARRREVIAGARDGPSAAGASGQAQQDARVHRVAQRPSKTPVTVLYQDGSA